MNFLTFKSTFQDYPVFSRTEIKKHFPNFDPKNLVRWQKKGYLLKVRNNWYCFEDHQWDERQLFWVANRIYTPSYISLEAALSYYGLIPEGVFTMQSISTRKTNTFATPIGHFTYATVKPSWYFGYQMKESGRLYCAIAEPAKALLDLLYLRPELQTDDQFDALRLNMAEVHAVLDIPKYRHYLETLAGPALQDRGRRLLAFIQRSGAYAVTR
ncbi:MAG: hypothetical protein KDC61_07855 [Saprospiraceae bacterium]|nr:hypothetical protein [Saprospiraceae bacterium]MCB9355400.1 hypothetical protein [Lewinellaceae bacterium]